MLVRIPSIGPSLGPLMSDERITDDALQGFDGNEPDKNWSLIYGQVINRDPLDPALWVDRLPGGRDIELSPFVKDMVISAGPRSTGLDRTVPLRKYETKTGVNGVFILALPYPAGTEMDVTFDGKDASFIKTVGYFPEPTGNSLPKYYRTQRTVRFPEAIVNYGVAQLGTLILGVGAGMVTKNSKSVAVWRIAFFGMAAAFGYTTYRAFELAKKSGTADSMLGTVVGGVAGTIQGLLGLGMLLAGLGKIDPSQAGKQYTLVTKVKELSRIVKTRAGV